MLGTPVQQPTITNWLTFSTFPFVIRTYRLTEVVGIREVKSDIGCVKLTA